MAPTSTLAPKPAASPEPEYDAKTDKTRHQTDEIQAVVSEHKKTKKRRPLVNGLLGLVLTGATGSGGYGLYKSTNVEDQTRDRSVRTEERLTNHIDTEAEARKDLKRRTGRLERGQRTIERKIDKQSMQNELILDAMKVPKSKRPAAIEEEPEPEDTEVP